ncbi:MAG: hypothetical protein BGO69_14960 [Bacteroidetes bacterium 46-16]|nr:MAG: hypothetical protein BGO69_14960 [Bacteroidetes bacterium 46-16]
MSEKRKIKDQDIESIMGSLLRVGVLVSAGIVLIGGVLYIIQHGSAHPHYKTFRGEPSDLKGIKQIVTGVTEFHSRAVIQLGLLILIATPVARVLFSVFGFLLEEDYLYVIITLIVLAIIAFSLFSGIAG